jgi:hypothetical protein
LPLELRLNNGPWVHDPHAEILPDGRSSIRLRPSPVIVLTLLVADRLVKRVAQSGDLRREPRTV